LAVPPPVPAPSASTGVPSGPRVPPNPYGETGATSVSEATRLGRVDDRLHDHAAAEAPADQVDPVKAERVEQRGQVVRPVPDAAGRVHRHRVGVPEPAQVHRQRPVRRRQREHGRLPEQAGGDVAVHEQHRRPVAAPGLQHVLGQPRGRHPAGRDAVHQRGHRALQPPSRTSELPLTNEAGVRAEVGDRGRHLGRLDQPLDRRLGQHDLLDDLLLGDPVRAGLVGDLVLDQRRRTYAGQTVFEVTPRGPPSSASVFDSPSVACFAATYALLYAEP
jgi:hypothetical protein